MIDTPKSYLSVEECESLLHEGAMNLVSDGSGELAETLARQCRNSRGDPTENCAIEVGELAANLIEGWSGALVVGREILPLDE